ncbi:serine/threonine-protein kinase Chk1-like [Tubulanus polymorphus]|uniref:serine/threonine-protein kinase Chk1-like n=1 Tax=Tubulanus polymorphus TaxID=672921 RepID=UPI003DA63121
MSSEQSTAFVQGWDFVQTLGEGAYGEVKLAVNREADEAVAVKIIDLKKNGVNLESVRKEVIIHRMMTHENIIKFYGTRKESDKQYIFLQYASGGELFDRIEPDIGMPQSRAQFYFRQLLAGVEYLHNAGITHRDLKPENLLLDDADNLRISDFGLATVFRHKGHERKLDRCCGTVPYVAPEVLYKGRPYEAQPADLWSCGIILVTMLAGELPWDIPTASCREYNDWKDCKITQSPWTKIDNLALSLLRRLLIETVSRRAVIAWIKENQWYLKTFTAVKGLTSVVDSPFGANVFKRVCSGTDMSPPTTRPDIGPISFSQPENRHTDMISSSAPSPAGDLRHFCFSQPAHPDHMLLSSQYPGGTPGGSQTPMQRFVRRMTRFIVKTDADTTTRELKSVAEKLGYAWKKNSPGLITMTMVDRRKMNLIFKVSLIEMSANILLDFRLSKGDGIEFKRQFLKIKERLSPIISKMATISATSSSASSVATATKTAVKVNKSPE